MALAGDGGGTARVWGAGRVAPKQQLTWELLQPPNPSGAPWAWGSLPAGTPTARPEGLGQPVPSCGGERDFLPSRCRRKERGPCILTALPDEGKLRKSSVDPLWWHSEAQDSAASGQTVTGRRCPAACLTPALSRSQRCCCPFCPLPMPVGGGCAPDRCTGIPSVGLSCGPHFFPRDSGDGGCSLHRSGGGNFF